MVARGAAQKIIEQTLAQAAGRVDSAEVHITGSNVATSRFANNEMTQNQAPVNLKISLRVINDGRQIRLDTDDSSPAGIKTLVDNAVDSVRLLERDDKLCPLAETESAALVECEKRLRNRLEAKTAKLEAHDRAEHVRSIIEVAQESDLAAAGVVANGITFQALGNSNGLFTYHRETHAECSITMCSPDSSGWTKAQGPLGRMVDPRALAKAAAQKALLSRNPIEVKPGKYTVILEHSATLELLGFMLWDLAATSHLDKRSFLVNRLGEKVFGDNITISDDVYHPEQAGPAFDAEGVPKQRVEIVKNGVLKNLVFGRRSARLMGAKPTGHGWPEPNPIGEQPMNIVFEGHSGSEKNGPPSVEDMVKDTEHGILLTRVWYVRDVDPAQKTLTGMTRDGTFLIENGEIKHGIKNMRFNISMLDVLNNVEQMSNARRTACIETFPNVVPALKVRDFNFTEVTRF